MRTIALLATVFVSAGMMPAGTPPVIKMGLWEMTTVVRMDMPGMPMPPSTTKVRNCYTLASWLKTMQPATSKDCAISNAGWTGRTYTFDLDCAGSKTHSETTYPDATTGHGMLRMEINSGGQHVVSNATYETHFLNSDCGKVTPEEPEILP